MSVTTAPETDECEQCDSTFQISHAVEGNYCSAKCYYRSKGEGPLAQLRHDHTVCGTCFARLKETQRPSDDYLRRAAVPPSIREVFVGFEYPTPNAEHAETTIDAGEYGIHDRVTTGLGCRCGATDTHEPDATLERVEGAAVVVNLLRQLRRLYDAGSIDHAPSKDGLFDALRDEGRDWEYAIGRCLYG